MQKSAPFLPRHIINLLLGYTVISQNVSGVPNSWPLNPIVNPRFLVNSHLRNHSCRGAVSISLRLYISVFRAPSRRWEWTKGPRAWSQVVVIFLFGWVLGRWDTACIRRYAPCTYLSSRCLVYTSGISHPTCSSGGSPPLSRSAGRQISRIASYRPSGCMCSVAETLNYEVPDSSLAKSDIAE